MKKRIASDLDLRPDQVAGVLALLDEGSTVPFIARYRKERTGGLDEVQIRDVAKRAEELQSLEDRRDTVLGRIREQGALTESLEKKIRAAQTRERLEDLYAPHKKKRKTRGQKARDAGLEPVADAIADGESVRALAQEHVCEEFPTSGDVIDGAKDILSERIADDAEIRKHVRVQLRKHGRLTGNKRRGSDRDDNFDRYYDFAVHVKKVRPHQILALRRGESEKKLSVSVEMKEEPVTGWIDRQRNEAHSKYFREAIEDGYKRLLHPSAERDIRRELEEKADAHAIDVFAINLRNLLLQPPLPDRRVMGIDPGYRTGCKVAVVDESGGLLTTDHIFVHDGRAEGSKENLRAAIGRFDVDVVAIGNGTASSETERLVADVLGGLDDDVRYTVVDEAGASVYSASDVAREEFPDLDVSYRGAVSIARRLQDPLAELVKIDPKSIGVGMYQHDVNQTRLSEALDAVVEDVVNQVGVDLQSASPHLLAHISGLGPVLAGRVVEWRDEHGGFERREQLRDVKGVGDKVFRLAAGFLRVRDGEEPLDETGVHPENYDFARRLLVEAGVEVGGDGIDAAIDSLRESGKLQSLADEHDIGDFTLSDICESLTTPGRDPRDELPAPELRTEALSLKDLREGMKLTGTVRNVVDFGAFVDVGVKCDGLVHISKMADKYVKDPHAIVGVGDRIDVTVVSVDAERERIGLSMVD